MLNNMKQNMETKNKFNVSVYTLVHQTADNIFILHWCAFVKVNLGNMYISTQLLLKNLIYTRSDSVEQYDLISSVT